MKDEILENYSISEFLCSKKCSAWKPDTRRYYENCLQDLLAFVQGKGAVTQELLTDWQNHLKETYGRTAFNVHITAANNYFRWCGRYDLLREHAKGAEDPDTPSPNLTRIEYLKLLRAARRLDKPRTYLLVKLFVTTGLPIQCLDQVTVELAKQGHGILQYRGKTYDFCCPGSLQKELLDYMSRNGIYHGPVFISYSGQPLNRVTVFRNLQELCQAAGVPEEKGNPRALRNLYKATQKKIDDRLAAMKNQMYDQLLEMEQESIGWQPEPNGSNLTA